METDFKNCSITTSELRHEPNPLKAIWILNGLNDEITRNFLVSQSKLNMKIGDEIHGYNLLFRLKVICRGDDEYLGLVTQLISSKPEIEASFDIQVTSLLGSSPTVSFSEKSVYLTRYSPQADIGDLLLLKGVTNESIKSFSPMRFGVGPTSRVISINATKTISPSFHLGIAVTPIHCNTVTEPQFSSELTATVDMDSIKTFLRGLQSLSKNFGDLYLNDQESFPDLKLESKDGTMINAHKFVLAARCPTFKQLIETTAKQNEFDGTIKIDDVNAKPLLALVHWMYTGQLQNDVEKCMEELATAAVKYDVKELADILDKQLIKICHKGNMIQLLQMAQQNHMETAGKQISEFIKANL